MMQPPKKQKIKKQKKDTVYNPDSKFFEFLTNIIVHDDETPSEIEARRDRYKTGRFWLNDF